MILVELLNLTFENEVAAGGTQTSNSLHYVFDGCAIAGINSCSIDIDALG